MFVITEKIIKRPVSINTTNIPPIMIINRIYEAVYINSTNIPPIMITNRIHETPSSLVAPPYRGEGV